MALYFVLIFYAPLILKGVFSLTYSEKIFRFLPRWIGAFEYYLSPFRDTLFSYFLLIDAINRLVHRGWQTETAIFLALTLYSQATCMFALKNVYPFCESKID